MKKYIRVLAVLSAFAFLSVHCVHAQDSGVGVAISVPMTGDSVSGNVVCGSEGSTNKLCSREYDPNMIGVITDNPALSFVSDGAFGNIKYVLSTGKAYVIVSSVNGTIAIGDYITSSRVAGVAQKATKSGYILGSAMEEYKETDKTKTGRILVSLNVKPAVLKQNAEANLLQMIKDGVEGAFQSPLSALRYIVASLIVSVTLIYGFIHFGRIAKSGVDAIGRNPLATKAIQTGVIMNMVITVLIMGVSVFVGYMILVI